jgi:two-component system copper resistance phosphate regulon response regulator CusR
VRILLVEDDKGIVRFVRKGLSENSFSVDVASNGEEGLEWALHKGSTFTVYLPIQKA